MSGDGTMIYNPMGLSDTVSSLLSFSQELDQIGSEAHNLLAASQEFFQGPNGAVSYSQAQTLINEASKTARMSSCATVTPSTAHPRRSSRPTTW